MTVQKIVPNLWFNGNAKEAVGFYTSVFPDGEVISAYNYPNSAEEGLADFQLDMAGKALSIDFKLGGQRFTAINAGPEFKFTEAVSFAVFCKDQAEIDYYWGKLSFVPESEQCGWCKDKFGLSWQVVPKNMNELMQTPNRLQDHDATKENNHRRICLIYTAIKGDLCTYGRQQFLHDNTLRLIGEGISF